MDNLNLRHTMAQHAGRASVGLHTLIFFRGRDEEEDAYVIKVRENGVVVLVPRYGIEGIVYVCEAGAKNPFTFVRPRPAHAHAHARSPLRPSSPPPTAGAVRAQDANEELLRAPGCVLRTFDKVRVRISVDSSKAHRPKLKLQITQPVLPKA